MQRIISLVVLTIVVTPGCMTGAALEPAFPGGSIDAFVVSAPSEASITDASDPRLARADILQKVINRALASPNGAASMGIETWESYESLERALTDEMYYDGPSGVPGYYIRKDGHVIRVNTMVLL